MKTNMLNKRVHLQEKATTLTATGQMVYWKPVQTLYARVIPLDARIRLAYQQMNSEVNHLIILGGNVDISLGNNRILYGSKIFEPMEPPKYINDNTTIAVREI